MKKLVITIIFITHFINCATKTKNTLSMEDQNKKAINNTPKVTGIGGVFYYSDNVKEARDWYAKNLGFEITDWGSSSFESRDIEKPEVVNTTEWNPFKKGDAYFSPSKKEFMINYRVQNIEGLVAKLKENGVTVLDEIAIFDYGKFVHIMDHEDNKIELWEPIQ